MSNYNLAQVRDNQDTNNLNLPKEAAQILEVLNELENFTISIRTQVMEEIKSASKPICLNLRNFNQE